MLRAKLPGVITPRVKLHRNFIEIRAYSFLSCLLHALYAGAFCYIIITNTATSGTAGASSFLMTYFLFAAQNIKALCIFNETSNANTTHGWMPLLNYA